MSVGSPTMCAFPLAAGSATSTALTAGVAAISPPDGLVGAIGSVFWPVIAVSEPRRGERIVRRRAPLGVVGEPLEARAGLHRRVALEVAREPGQHRALDVAGLAAAGQADAVAAAEPDIFTGTPRLRSDA